MFAPINWLNVLWEFLIRIMKKLMRRIPSDKKEVDRFGRNRLIDLEGIGRIGIILVDKVTMSKGI